MKKKKSRSSKPQQKVSARTSLSNLFLNIIILILFVLIVFMSYSLYIKLSDKTKNELSENKKSAAEIVQLEVLNGCGVSGIADKFTEYLRENNFDVVFIGNYRSFDMDKTMVIDRTGNKLNALKVANALGIEKQNVIQQINNNYFLDVTLIIGRDYNQLKPIKD